MITRPSAARAAFSPASTLLAYQRRARLDSRPSSSQAAHPEHESVTAVAYRWASPVPGRFAAYYRTGDARISMSVATIEFAKSADGTSLTVTKQGACLDGIDRLQAPT